MSSRLAVGLLGLALVAGCGDNLRAAIELRVDGVKLDPGEERADDCVSFTLDNDEPLYVDAATLEAGLGWHHTIWFFVKDTSHPGADGVVTPCSARGFDLREASVGAGIVFASSPQVRNEVQRFSPGTVVRIPPRSKLIAQLHLFSTADQPIETHLDLTLETIAEQDVAVQLAPFALAYFPLELQPHQDTMVTADCDFGGPLDLNLYYGLPHFHSLGTSLTLEAVGADGTTRSVFGTQAALGEPLGQSFTPAVDLHDTSRLSLSCGYRNTRDRMVGWGNGQDEMCIFFGFTDSAFRWLGAATEGAQVASAAGEPRHYRGSCTVLALPNL